MPFASSAVTDPVCPPDLVWRRPTKQQRTRKADALQTPAKGGYHGGHASAAFADIRLAMTADLRSTSARAQVEPLAPEATIKLLDLVRQGDDQALDRLFERCIPALRRWARGRLPQSARGMLDTVDLVQDTVVAAMRNLKAFDSRHQGALQAYLRQAVMHRIYDLARQRKRRPEQVELPDDLSDEKTSPLDRLIGSENVKRYEDAVQRLDAADRQAIIGRLEMEYSYAELAVVLGKPTPDAARVAVMRAMKRLADEMRRAC
jgi:RNA polymerase sigma-70 factor (ECF subfamily)